MDVREGSKSRVYVKYIMVDSRLEEVKIVVVRKASSQESVPQSSNSWEKAVQIEILSY